MGVVVGFGVALVAALLLTPAARRASFKLGILDTPGPLKVQREPVPYLGGVAVFAALGIALAAWQAWWLIPLALAALLGVADDVRSISPRLRLAGQFVVGIVAGLVEPAPGRFGVLLTAVFVVVLVNAVNLIDGMDGLASSVVAISAIAFAIAGTETRVPALAVCGALLGFLFFNRAPARIYLGDCGAYVLGTSLALLIACSLESRSAAAWIAFPFFVAIPLADTAIAVLRRQRAGLPILAGDRSHVYDQLSDRGWTVFRVVVLCAALQSIAAAIGLVCWHLGFPAAALTAFGAVAVGALAVWRFGFVRTGVHA